MIIIINQNKSNFDIYEAGDHISNAAFISPHDVRSGAASPAGTAPPPFLPARTGMTKAFCFYQSMDVMSATRSVRTKAAVPAISLVPDERRNNSNWKFDGNVWDKIEFGREFWNAFPLVAMSLGYRI